MSRFDRFLYQHNLEHTCFESLPMLRDPSHVQATSLDNVLQLVDDRYRYAGGLYAHL